MIMSLTVLLLEGGTYSIISVSFKWKKGSVVNQFSLLLTGSSSDSFVGLDCVGDLCDPS